MYVCLTSGQYNSPSVRGRLSLCYDQWVKLGASGFILSVVRDGKVPFVTLPPPKVSPNNHSGVTHSHFVSEAISDLLRTKCVEILDHKPDIVNPLSVSIQPSGKKRLILDLRHVNLYVFLTSLDKVTKWLLLNPKGMFAGFLTQRVLEEIRY